MNYLSNLLDDQNEEQPIAKAQESVGDLNLRKIMSLPPRFFDGYWDYVDACVTWIYGSVTKAVSPILASGRSSGHDSDEYKQAAGALRSFVMRYAGQHPTRLDVDIVSQMVEYQILGMGIIEPIWRDENVEELFIDGPSHVNIIYHGKKLRVPAVTFKNKDHVYRVVSKVLEETNRKDLDFGQNHPYLDARLSDLSRVAGIHDTICPGGPVVDIRRHPTHYWTLSDIVAKGTCSREMIQDLAKWIEAKMSILVIGETGSGKTTFLDAISGLFPASARIWTIEDVQELELNPNKPFKVPGCEVKLPNKDGGNGFTIKDHVKASLRMMPDIVVIGETRDSSAYDLMDAANTGHQVFSTLHANSADSAIDRLVDLISSGGDIKGRDALGMIASAFDVIVHIGLDKQDYVRRVMEISEVAARPVAESFTTADGKTITGDATVPTTDLWQFQQTGLDEHGHVIGDWVQVADISPTLARRKRLPFTRDFTWDDCVALVGLKDRDTPIRHGLGDG